VSVIPDSQRDGHEEWQLQTSRLTIRRASVDQSDIDLLLRLWTDPEVMKNVGFPDGLPITAEKIEKQLRTQPSVEYDCVLIVILNDTGERIGEAKLESPDELGVAKTDIKLLPAYWGNGYGREIKRALLQYLFDHTDCRMVQVSPNRNNKASIRMQEAVGGRRIGEGVYRFPESMRDYTCDVPYFDYAVFREDWIRIHGT
jgi:RimJ/RimL family protein N-acetyltransferase